MTENNHFCSGGSDTVKQHSVMLCLHAGYVQCVFVARFSIPLTSLGLAFIAPGLAPPGPAFAPTGFQRARAPVRLQEK